MAFELQPSRLWSAVCGCRQASDCVHCPALSSFSLCRLTFHERAG